jgi:putative phage-type endonuclease
MPVESIKPKNEKEWLALRTKDITSTEISALFGISPYTTEFELWHRKKDNIEIDFEVNERMQWGTRLQDAIAKGIAEDQKWKVRRMDEYMRIPELRIGASFDFSIEGKDVEPGLLEIKNVDSLMYKQGWSVDGDSVEAPPHIELQVQHQLAVSCRQYAHLGALVGGNRVVLLKREPDLVIIQAIKDKVAAFWKSIDDGVEPKPNFERDSEFIAKLYGYAEPGKVMDLRGNTEFNTLAARHRELGSAMKACEEERDGLKAQMLMIIGDAEKCTADGCSVSAGLIGPAHVEYDREGYRAFKLNWPRAKKEK